VADNTVLNAGAGGDTVATDDIAGVKHQLVKVEFGVADSATPVSTTNPLPVDQTNTTVADGGVLPAKGVQIGGTDGSVFQVMSTDNAGRPNVNVNGTVTVDTELPAAAALADAVANPTVPGVGGFALMWNGATWDRVPGSATNGLTANLKALNGTTIDTNSGAKSAGTQRVILASDQTVVPISDNSGSLTVDAPVGTPAFVRLSDGAAAITALPVTDNAGSLTVDNGGTFAVQDSQKVADNAAFTDGTTPVQPAGYIFDEVAGTALTENDAAAARIDSKRAQVGVIEDATTRGQRAAVSAAGAVKVDGSAVTQPVSGTVSITANSAVNVAQVAGTTTAVNAGTNSAGVQRVTLATDQTTLTNTIGNVGVVPVTSGGLTTFHLVSAATTNATNVKASAGQLYGWYIYNSNAAARKVAFHNSAGTPTAGASIFFAIVIPPTSAANVEYTTGIAFGTGIAITTVTDLTDAGATAVAASDLIINLVYK
jgi:hypothetical protein